MHIVKLLKLYSLLAQRNVSSSIIQSQSLASQNQAFHQHLVTYALSIACFHHKQQLFMQVSGAVICHIIVCNAVSFVDIHVVILSRSSFDRYNER